MILTLLTELYSTYKKKTYLQCEILALLTILFSTYNTKLAVLTYNEMLTLLKVLYSTLYIYKTATLLTLRITYATKTEKRNGGAGKYGKF